MIAWMAWRLHRRALIGFGAGGFAISFLYGFAYSSAAGDSADTQAAFGRSISLAARQFTFLIPPPVHPETLGGYEQYKWLSAATVMLMIWAGLAAAGAARGEEDRGLTEQWLAAGLARNRLYLARGAAFALAALAACAASVLGIVAAAPLVHQDANLAGDAAKALSMAAGMLAAYALALLLAQLPADRSTATTLGVGAVVALLVVNGIADTVPGAGPAGVVSPFHWMERTTSAAPGGSFDVSATAGLLAAAAGLLALSMLAFQRRDVGSGLWARPPRVRPARRSVSQNPLLRTPLGAGLWEQRAGLAIWASGTLVLGALMVSITRSVVDALFTDPHVAAVFGHALSGSPYAAMLGLLWFGLALLLLAGYAVVQVARWAGLDQDGRLEMLLTAPIGRERVVTDRGLEFAIASLVIVAGGYAGAALALPAAGLHLDPVRVLAASVLLWPFALAFGGLGVALASRWPRLAVPVLAAFAGVEYFVGDLAPVFQAPAWLADLSVFHLYGNPVAGPLAWWPPLAMGLVFVAGFAAARRLLRGRDLSSG